MECPDLDDGIKEGDEIQIDFENGKIIHMISGAEYTSTQFPEFMEELINSGGLMNWIKERGLV